MDDGLEVAEDDESLDLLLAFVAGGVKLLGFEFELCLEGVLACLSLTILSNRESISISICKVLSIVRPQVSACVRTNFQKS